MPLSNAERQRRYREKRKADETFRQKERERRMKYYIPTSELPPRQQTKRRALVNIQVREHRKRKRDENVDTHNNDTTSLDPSVSRANNIEDQKKRTRKRVTRVGRKYKKLYESSEVANIQLKRRVKTLEKRCERAKKKIETDTVSPACSSYSPKSPRSKVFKDLRSSGLSPTKFPKRMLKKMTLTESLLSEISFETFCADEGKKRFQEIVKKYRLRQTAGKVLKTSRNTVGKKIGKILKVRQAALKAKSVVSDFFNRDDVSRIFPGKRDFVKIGTEKVQKRMLVDYTINIFKKFVGEVGIKMSYSAFCKLRPKNIILVKFCSRNICLCIYCQNMGLKLNSLKKMAVVTTDNPEEYLRTNAERQCPQIFSNVSYMEWKRVTQDNGRKKIKLVSESIDGPTFQGVFEVELQKYATHIKNIKNQCVEQRNLKENLQVNHVLVLMDFSENYSCVNLNEVQSAYWGQSQATIHPIIVYYKSRNSSLLEHKTFVVVSNSLQHNSLSVYSFIKSIIPKISELVPGFSKIIYWTDGPTSQYKNRTIFSLIEQHKTIFGVEAEWNYCETGHGKGPHDGIGGMVKRLADDAVKHSKCIIQSAEDLMAFLISIDSSMNFVWVSADDISKNSEFIKKLSDVAAVKDTFKVHQCSPGPGEGTVMVRNLSCQCVRCVSQFPCERIAVESHRWRIEKLFEYMPEVNDVVAIKADGADTFYLFKINSIFQSRKALKCPTYGTLLKGKVLRGQYYEYKRDTIPAYSLMPQTVLLTNKCVFFKVRNSFLERHEFLNFIMKQGI